jgi:hypothetical protein
VESDFDNTSPIEQKRLVGDWQLCINSIEEIASLLRYWDPHYSRLTDPMISCVIWISSAILILHTMLISYQEAKRLSPIDNLQENLDILITTLDGFSRYWPIAVLLLSSY